MKEFRWVVLLLICFSFTASLLAEGSFQIKTTTRKEKPVQEADEVLPAGGSIGAAIYENLTSNMGQLKLNGTTVKQKLYVEGSLFTQSAHLGSVVVYGEANLKNSTVSSTLEAIGYLKAEGTTFQGPLTLGGIKAAFTNSKIPSIVFRKEDSFKGKQVIELKHRTIVDGSIIFESAKGEVHCYPGCQVLGTISGGKLIKKTY